MPVTVQFRGVCMFLMDGQQRVSRVLLPNAETVTQPDDGSGGNFADGKPAKRHWAGLAIARGTSTRLLRVPLLGMEVRIDGGGGNAPKVDDRMRMMPLNDVVNDGLAPKVTLRTRDIAPSGNRLAATVDLLGGSIDTTAPSGLNWGFSKSHNAGHTHAVREMPTPVVWTGGAASATISIGAPGAPPDYVITVGKDDTVIIHNFDFVEPTLQELTQPGPCTAGGPIEDTDFRWLYQLLAPPTGDWKTWLTPAGFPVPEGNCPPPAAGTTNVSTCFGSGWDT